MKMPRVLFVTRQFWPLVGGAEKHIAALASALVARGGQATIVTARWQKDWPEAIEHQGVRVIRLPQPRWRFIGTICYTRALRGWIRAHAHEFDLVYVSMLKDSASIATNEALRADLPVVLRATSQGPLGDIAWQQQGPRRRGIAEICESADAFVAPSPAIEQELITADYDEERIHAIPNGVAVPESANDSSRRKAARQALASADHALRVDGDAPVVLYVGRLHPEKGLETLLAAWPKILAQYPNARLWLIGKGIAERQLRQQIAELGIAKSVALPGVFDDVEDALAAANLFVHPSRSEGMSRALLEAMAAGLPILASDISGNRNVLDSGTEGLFFPVGDDAALSSAVLKTLADRDLGQRLGTAARERVRRDYSLDMMVDRHLQLFDTLTSRSEPA